MKVAILGASGHVGKHLVDEALQRGHTVTGIARRPEKIEQNIAKIKADVTEADALIQAIKENDAVISSVRFANFDPHALVAAVKKANVKRLLVVGGAGSLKLPNETDLVDSPVFPAEWKDEAKAGREFLRVLREEKELDWTFVSPSVHFEPGARTGKFRIGKDHLLTDAEGVSAISMQDYAMAMLDELENPRHTRQRFTVGY